MDRPPLPDDARAAIEIWSTPDGVDSAVFVAEDEDRGALLALREGIEDIRVGNRKYDLADPTWLAQFILRGEKVACAHGRLGAPPTLARRTLGELAEAADTVLDLEAGRYQREHRLGIVEALVRAIDRWDVLSAIIAASADPADAIERLAGDPFHFDQVQAQHVLDLRVAQRTRTARAQLREEATVLRESLES